jgi:hypothetical protein
MELAERHSSSSPHSAEAVGSRLQWSRWSRCESSFSLLLVPSRPGIFAVSEEIVAPGTNGKRLLALLLFSETPDLARDLNRLFTPASPIYERIAAGRCFVRYALVDDPDERRAAASALKEWLVESAELASGLPQAFVNEPEVAQSPPAAASAATMNPAGSAQRPDAQPQREFPKPAPFPAGF